MSNTTLTNDIILKEGQRLFKNSTPFLQAMDRQYDGTYETMGAKSGSDIRIRKPMKYSVREGKTSNVQDNTENSVTLSKVIMKGVDLKFSTAELTQDISQFSKLYIKPAINALASNIENDIMSRAVNGTYNQVGVEGVNPSSALTVLNAGAKLDEFSTPMNGDRTMILNPFSMASTVDGLKGLFNSQVEVGKQYIKGQMGTALGFDFASTANVPSHTSGSSDGAYEVAGASQTGSSLIVDQGTGTYTVGDIFTIVGVNAVNPTTKVDSGQLQQFVVTAVFAGGSGTISISPSIIVTGSQQTVTASPANNANLVEATGFTASATNRVSLAFDEMAFAFGTVDLDMPSALPAEARAREVVDGISMRLLNYYDGNNDDSNWRLDILYGFVPVTPEWAVRIAAA